MPANGVRRSCDTHATSSRRVRSVTRWRSSATAASVVAVSSSAANLSAPSTPAVPAPATTTTRAERSWVDTNMALAAASAPAPRLTTGMRATTTARVRNIGLGPERCNHRSAKAPTP